MFRHRGDRIGEVVLLLLVDVMRKEKRIVIQHYEVATDPYAWRQTELPAAGPAAVVGRRVRHVVKVFCVTVSAVDDRVAQTDHHCAPVAFTHATMLWIGDSVRKRPRENVAQKF